MYSIYEDNLYALILIEAIESREWFRVVRFSALDDDNLWDEKENYGNGVFQARQCIE